MEKFKLTEHEAAILEKIADATKMDAWFRIDDDLNAFDAEGDMPNASSAEVVIALEDGLGYGLREPQSGGLTSEEAKVAKECFSRARFAAEEERIEELKEDVAEGVLDLNSLIERYLEHFYDQTVGQTVHRACDVLSKAKELESSEDPIAAAAGRRLEELVLSHPDAEYFDLRTWEPIGRAWLIERLGIKFWSVPVVCQRYGTICVAADSAREAYRKVRDNPEEWPLPDEDFYVEESLSVAEEDEDRAVAIIEEISQ